MENKKKPAEYAGFFFSFLNKLNKKSFALIPSFPKTKQLFTNTPTP